MKKVLISIVVMLICIELIGQKTKSWPTISFGSKVEKTKEVTLDHEQIKLGYFFLYLPKLKNQVFRAVLSYKPDKKKFEMLDDIKFKNITIDYVVHPDENERKNYSGILNIDKEDLVGKRELYYSCDLFSLSDYDWEWDDVPFGTTTKKIKIKITKLQMNGKVLQKIPGFFEGLKLEFKFKDTKSRFEDLSNELLNRGIYPNKEAFEILFNSNPKVFFENEKNISSKDLANLKFPQLEGIGEASQSTQKYNFDEDQLQSLQSKLERIIKSVKLKNIFDKDSKKIKKQLQEILNFISRVLKSGISINYDTGKFLHSEIRFLIKVINDKPNPNPKISGEELDNFNSIIDDIAFIVKLMNYPSNSNGSINDTKGLKNVARLVNYTPPKMDMWGDDASVYVIANTTFDSLNATNIPANGYTVKCIPWGRRDQDIAELKKDEVLWTFPDPSTPTSYPVLPIAKYCFWVENKDGNKIPLEDAEDWCKMIKIRSKQKKLMTWLLRLIQDDKPLLVPIGLINPEVKKN